MSKCSRTERRHHADSLVTGSASSSRDALMSKSLPLRAFWWLVLTLCVVCGVTTTTLVIIEYIKGPTSTSTTIRLVDSLELPGITICPKIPDIFDEEPLFRDLSSALPNVSYRVQLDVFRYFIAGNGLENMDDVAKYNQSYLQQLDAYYRIWSRGYTTQDFFFLIHDKYGYSCEQFFFSCNFAGKALNCCTEVFDKKIVIRRGVCWQTKPGLNQSEADDVGRLILSMRALRSMTSPEYNYTQPQLLVYITDNHDYVVDYPRYYLYPQQWSRMRFTARFMELIQSKDVCINKLFGKDAECVIRRWLEANIIIPFNCTLSYLKGVSKLPKDLQVCDPSLIVANYINNIQLVWTNGSVTEECIPGCKRWDYTVSLQQNPNIDAFDGYAFNLETSYNDLQYEYVKESYTTSVPGFMSQIGGQFGFFLGLSIITFLQMTIYFIRWVAVNIAKRMHRLYRTFSSADSSEKPNLDSMVLQSLRPNGHLIHPAEEIRPDRLTISTRPRIKIKRKLKENDPTKLSTIDTGAIRSDSWELRNGIERRDSTIP
ncbi:unnamed protein product, partial [Mesorhabditis belari]|uniref:Uncharacterized protein n=1 Tax=Mesorhabditis belari TaxID=2138241 RepID=A0AAF3FQD9_9BILA